MMADNWTFSNLTVNDTSYFSPSVVANDLHGVQEFTDMILNPVVKEHNLLPPNIIEKLNFTDLDPFIEAIKNDYSTLFEQNTALTAMVVIGFAVALLIPISGIISCIVYCCCGGSKKGGQKQKTAVHIKMTWLTDLYRPAEAHVWPCGSNRQICKISDGFG